MKLNERYYTGVEVQKILNITEPRLRTLVANKKLKKVVPPGRKTGVYLKSEVDKFAEQWEAFLMAREAPTTTFEIPEIEDMEEENELDRRAIGGAGMTAAVRAAWFKVNPEMDYHVRHNGKLVAFLRLLPIKHETLMNFMEGKIRGKDIPPEAIETFEPGKPIECLVIGIASDPEADNNAKAHYVLTLLRGASRKLEELGEQGVVIKKIYATSESATGIASAIHIGMTQLPSKLSRRVKFEMEVDKSESFLAIRYKQGLERWKKEQRRQQKLAKTANNVTTTTTKAHEPA